jgi:hypothetical protein
MSTITLSEFKRRHPHLADVADNCARTISKDSVERSAGVDYFPEDLLALACETSASEQRNAASGSTRTASMRMFSNRSA